MAGKGGSSWFTVVFTETTTLRDLDSCRSALGRGSKFASDAPREARTAPREARRALHEARPSPLAASGRLWGGGRARLGLLHARTTTLPRESFL